jgi:hypothetical protein
VSTVAGIFVGRRVVITICRHRQSQSPPQQSSSPKAEERQGNQAEDKEYVLVDDKGSVEFNKRVDGKLCIRQISLANDG